MKQINIVSSCTYAVSRINIWTKYLYSTLVSILKQKVYEIKNYI